MFLDDAKSSSSWVAYLLGGAWVSAVFVRLSPALMDEILGWFLYAHPGWNKNILSLDSVCFMWFLTSSWKVWTHTQLNGTRVLENPNQMYPLNYRQCVLYSCNNKAISLTFTCHYISVHIELGENPFKTTGSRNVSFTRTFFFLQNMWKNMQQRRRFESRNTLNHLVKAPWVTFQKMKRRIWSYNIRLNQHCRLLTSS